MHQINIFHDYVKNIHANLSKNNLKFLIDENFEKISFFLG